MTDSLREQSPEKHLAEARPDRFARVPWPAVAVFVAVAYGLAWLVALPLWIVDFEPSAYATLFGVLAGAMMFTPTLAALVVVFLMKRPGRERMRLLGIWPLRPAKRVVWFSVVMNFVPVLLVAACLGISAMFGWLQLDLSGFSGFRQAVDAQIDGLGLDPEATAAAQAAMPPIGMLVAVQIGVILLGGVLNMIPALGEEIGWRGWLLPALRPLGAWPALLVSGAIWGLWHAPVILLGYNFNRTDWVGVVLMIAGCTAWGVFFGWLRLRTASIWPSAIAHASFNAAGGLLVIGMAATDTPPDMLFVNPLGVPGWILLAVVVSALLVTGQFSREPQLAPAKPKWAPPGPVTPS